MSNVYFEIHFLYIYMHLLCFVKAGEDTGFRFLTLTSQYGCSAGNIANQRMLQQPALFPRPSAGTESTGSSLECMSL